MTTSSRWCLSLFEICVGVVLAAVAGCLGTPDALRADSESPRFLRVPERAYSRCLAGTELEPEVMRKKLKEVTESSPVTLSPTV